MGCGDSVTRSTALAWNPSTLKVHFDSIAGKVIYALKVIGTGCTGENENNCCALWDWENVIMWCEGITACTDDLVISVLDERGYCAGTEDPCNYVCNDNGYWLEVISPWGGGGNIVVQVLGLTGGVGDTSKKYFYQTISCTDLPVEVSNSYTDSGDCGGIVKGYGGTITLYGGN